MASEHHMRIAQRQPLVVDNIDLNLRSSLRSQVPPEEGSTSRIANPSRWLTAKADYYYNTNQLEALALLKNVRAGDDHLEWKLDRFLGAGSFGAAAVFQQQDNGQIIDVCAIKASPGTSDGRKLEPENGAWPHITMEAAIMTQLNKHPTDGFLCLRKYR
jgi:hypothetical protein